MISPDKKRRGSPAGEPDGELLREMLQVEGVVLCALGRLGHRSKGIDNHHGGARRFDFLSDARKELLQRAVVHVLAQIDKGAWVFPAGQIEEGARWLLG